MITLERSRVELGDVVTKLFDFYSLMAEERNVVLSLKGVGLVLGDRPMLSRAISNLLTNALRYTPPGEAIRVFIEQAENVIILSVENPGRAIDAEHLGKLFDRFYRADPARREGSPGNAGIGLAITQSIVNAHKGRIWCVSDEKSTSFHIELPGALVQNQHGIS